MNDNEFVKLFDTIITSSIWEEDNSTRILWITMLALANKDGKVFADPRRLAKWANISPTRCKVSLKKLESPDKHSRTPDNEGRRIKRIQGGWLILNHKLYREKGRNLERKAYKREWDRKNRPSGHARKQSDKVRQNRPITDTDTNTNNKGVFSSSKKATLFPIAGKTCNVEGCRMPAVYKDSSGAYDNYKCLAHAPKEVRELYE